MKSLALILTASVLLSACALTPEQRAEREAAQKRYEQELQVSLAAQCDLETADLMRQQFDQSKTFADEKTKQDFRVRYVEKINNPLFQSCYRMAWQNYMAQQRLSRLERLYDWDRRFSPWWTPYWW